jgi:SUN domain-containing protein 1/2
VSHQYQEDDTGQIDTSADIEQGLDSIPEVHEPPLANNEYPATSQHHISSSSSYFSIGGLLGKLVNLMWRMVAGLVSLFFGLAMMIFMLIGRVCGTAFEVVFSRPGRWLSNANPGPVVQLGKYAVVGLTVYAAWYVLQDRSLAQWIPSLPSSRPYYHAPDVPAANIAELSARLQSIENALSGLSIDHERSRSKLDTEVKNQAEVLGRLGNLETRMQRENVRALEAEQQYRISASQGLQAVRQEVEVLQAQLQAAHSAGGDHGDVEANDEEARVRLKTLEERVGSVEGGVKEALEMGKHSVKAGGGSNAAWWNKLTTGRSGLTIKSTDGQDVTSLIGHLVDSAVSQYGKDNLARPDFALHSSGAKTIATLTSPTFEIRPSNFRGQLMGMVTGNGYAIGRPPVTALHHELHNGHCWPFAGTEGQLAVALAAPTYISDITIDHVAKEVAFDMRSAPREMEVWAMVEGKDNVAKVKAWQKEKAAHKEEARKMAKEMGLPFVEEVNTPYPRTLPKSPQYIRIANFTYNIHAPRNIQTFPVDEEIRNLGVDFGIVVLRIKSNWGRDDYTCLYRLRVHGQRMGETPLPYPEESA